MKKALMVVLVTFIGLTGCASYGDYGGSSRYSRGQETLPGMNAQETYAIGGGILGWNIGDALGLSGPQQAGTILLGTVFGSGIGGERDQFVRQVGRTNCTWRSSGYVDSSGMPQQSKGYYDCRGGNSTYGNRNYPPRAYPQSY